MKRASLTDTKFLSQPPFVSKRHNAVASFLQLPKTQGISPLVSTVADSFAKLPSVVFRIKLKKLLQYSTTKHNFVEYFVQARKPI